MTESAKVFVVDDQIEVTELLTDLFARRNRLVRGFVDGDAALAALAETQEQVDLVVLDLDLGPGRRDGLSILTDIRGRYPDLPCVILTGKAKVDDAVKAMRIGATDFIEKDPRLHERMELQMEKLDRLTSVLRDNRRLRRHNMVLEEQAGFSTPIIGAEKGLRAVMQQVRSLASIPRPVLILGERGTGKELIAHALHVHSDRKGPFVTINCAALPQNLAEAELFGFEKGAFTDADKPRIGKFELAHEGTLFLDEVGNMPMDLQQKILRVIEYQSFGRLGSDAQVNVDVRIVAATNADLDAAMEAGTFRKDLFDRLAFDVIRVPPLRERKQDLEDLCRYFVLQFAKEVAGISCTGISAQALSAISCLEFPGNVRELRNLIERAAYKCEGEQIQPRDLALGHGESSADPRMQGSGFHEQVEAFEKNLLTHALDTYGNMTKAAKALGLSYDQIRRLVKKHQL